MKEMLMMGEWEGGGGEGVCVCGWVVVMLIYNLATPALKRGSQKKDSRC